VCGLCASVALSLSLSSSPSLEPHSPSPASLPRVSSRSHQSKANQQCRPSSVSSSVTVLSYVFCAILSLLVLLVWRDARLVVSSSSGEMAAVQALGCTWRRVSTVHPHCSTTRLQARRVRVCCLEWRLTDWRRRCCWCGTTGQDVPPDLLHDQRLPRRVHPHRVRQYVSFLVVVVLLLLVVRRLAWQRVRLNAREQVIDDAGLVWFGLVGDAHAQTTART